LKGFSWSAWRKQFPHKPFRWGDGVYVSTVDPDDNAALREYIRHQWHRHEEKNLMPEWESGE